MYMDKENLLSEGQAITATAVSTNVIDLGADRDIGPTNLRMRAQVVTEDFAAGGNGTLKVALQTSDVENFGSGVVTLHETGAIGKADLTNGKVITDIAIPLGTKRYLRANYTVATGPMTAGAVTTMFVQNSEMRRDYPNAI